MADMDMSALFQAIGVAIRDAQQAIETHAVQQFVQHFEPLPPEQARAAMGEKAAAATEATAPDATGTEATGTDAAVAPEAAETPPVLAPRLLRVALPGPGGAPRLAEVPTVALSHHSALALDQVTVRLTVSASLDDKTRRLRVTPLALKAATAGEAAEKPQDAQEIELVFKRDEAPEGFARLSREAVKLL